MIEGFPIEPSAVYDDSALRLALGVSPKALGNARRAGKLHFTRKGQRVLYLGKWILEWLENDIVAETGVEHE